MSTNNNLIPIPNGWYIDREGQTLDTQVLYQGLASMPSIRLDATDPKGNNPSREVNAITIIVKAGDHIKFSASMITSASGLGDNSPMSGARIGIDYYEGSNRITGLQSSYVPWNNPSWIDRTIDLIVPASVPSDGSNFPVGEQHVPEAIICWLQAWSSTYGSTDTGKAWFANTQGYLNPTSSGGSSGDTKVETYNGYDIYNHIDTNLIITYYATDGVSTSASFDNLSDTTAWINTQNPTTAKQGCFIATAAGMTPTELTQLRAIRDLVKRFPDGKALVDFYYNTAFAYVPLVESNPDLKKDIHEALELILKAVNNNPLLKKTLNL